MLIQSAELNASFGRLQGRFLLACLSSGFEPTVIYAAGMHSQLANFYRAMGSNAHHCLGVCTTAVEALELVARVKPGILTMVDDLPDQSLDQLSSAAKIIHPGIQTFAFLSRLENDSAKSGIQILVADRDILSDPDSLKLASMAVVTNTVYRSRSILECLNASEQYSLDGSSQTIHLSLRERQLLEAYALGLSNQETALRLGLSVRTVQTYSSNLLQKLGVNNRQKLCAVRSALASTACFGGLSVPKEMKFYRPRTIDIVSPSCVLSGNISFLQRGFHIRPGFCHRPQTSAQRMAARCDGWSRAGWAVPRCRPGRGLRGHGGRRAVRREHVYGKIQSKLQQIQYGSQWWSDALVGRRRGNSSGICRRRRE